MCQKIVGASERLEEIKDIFLPSVSFGKASMIFAAKVFHVLRELWLFKKIQKGSTKKI
jgi:hypothetical protein